MVHRDLKLANIMIKEDFTIKLADFGFAKQMIDHDFLMQSFCGTPITMAPEILRHEKYDSRCDIWSLGVMIFQMLYGRPPYIPEKGQGSNLNYFAS